VTKAKAGQPDGKKGRSNKLSFFTLPASQPLFVAACRLSSWSLTHCPRLLFTLFISQSIQIYVINCPDIGGIQ
jgi:hypothetical protein